MEDLTFTNWADGFPANLNTKDDCAVITSRDSYMWSDTDCGGLSASPLCQMGAGGSAGTTTVDTTSTTVDTTTRPVVTSTTTAYESMCF